VFLIEQLKMGTVSTFCAFVSNLTSYLSNFPVFYSEQELNLLTGSEELINRIANRKQID